MQVEEINTYINNLIMKHVIQNYIHRIVEKYSVWFLARKVWIERAVWER